MVVVAGAVVVSAGVVRLQLLGLSASSRRVRHLQAASLVRASMKHVCDIGVCVSVCVYYS